MSETCEPCQRGEHADCPIFVCNCTHDSTTNLIRRNRESTP